MTEQEGQKLSKKDFLTVTTLVAVGILVMGVIQKIEISVWQELITDNPKAFYALLNLIKR